MVSGLTRTCLGTSLAIVVLYAILVAPSDIGGLTVDRLVRVPVELAVIVAVLVVWPVRWLRAIVVLLAICLLVLRLADIGTGLAFDRPFNPVLDLPLLVSGWDLRCERPLVVFVGGGVCLLAEVPARAFAAS